MSRAIPSRTAWSKGAIEINWISFLEWLEKNERSEKSERELS